MIGLPSHLRIKVDLPDGDDPISIAIRDAVLMKVELLEAEIVAFHRRTKLPFGEITLVQRGSKVWPQWKHATDYLPKQV